MVLSNRGAGAFAARVALAGSSTKDPPLAFDGYVYGPTQLAVPLGRRAASANASSGEWGLDVELQPLTLQFWVQAV